ncbi:hypothetical protein CF319_g7975 [Tilletia indica]|nr:hypothetical protein CF319_g7975 [Tilletia indica]
MRTNVWWHIAVYARDRVLGAPPSASPGRVHIEPAGPNDVSAVLMVDHPLTRSAPSSMLFTVPARARVAIGHLETEDVPSALRASSFCSNAAGDEQQPYTPSTVRYYAPALDRFGSLLLSTDSHTSAQPTIPYMHSSSRPYEPISVSQPSAEK